MNVFQLLPVVVAAAIVFGLRRVRLGSELIPGVVMVAWFAIVLVLAQTGALAQFDKLPPRIPFIALGGVALGLVVSRVGPVKEALRAMPDWWPVALMSFRAPLEVGLYALFAEKLLPEQMTFSGRNFDILVGLSAPVIALLMWKGRAPKWLQWAFQIFGVALLVNVIGIAITSAPGPLHRDWPGEPLTVVAHWPYALLPGFLVPVAVLGHILAIAKLVRRTYKGRTSQTSRVSE
jgi:hypothetical protein